MRGIFGGSPPGSLAIRILDSILLVDGLKRDEVRDDRGNVVKMASLGEINSSPLHRVDEIRPTMEQLVPIRLPHRRDFASHYKRSLLITTACIIPAALIAVFSSFVYGMAFFWVSVLVVTTWWALRLRYRETDAEVRELYVRAVTRATLCPTCLYDLLGAEVDDEGLATCPECGSCWRSDRFVRTDPVHVPDQTSGFEGYRADRPVNQLMSLKSVRDENGQWFVLMNPRSKRLRKKIQQVDRLERIRRATRRSRKKGWFVRVFLCLILLAYLSTFLPSTGIASAMGSKLGPLRLLVPFFILLVFLRLIWLVLVGRLGVKPDRIVEDALGEDLCPACWADLKDTAIDTQQLIIKCPACGACWDVKSREIHREITP